MTDKKQLDDVERLVMEPQTRIELLSATDGELPKAKALIEIIRIQHESIRMHAMNCQKCRDDLKETNRIAKEILGDG